MIDDLIVEEVRKHRQAHTAKYNNELTAICAVLRIREQQSSRKVVNRSLRLLLKKLS